MGIAQPASRGTGGQDGPATRREARLGFSGQVTGSILESKLHKACVAKWNGSYWSFLCLQ